jgi:hypothetical protein
MKMKKRAKLILTLSKQKPHIECLSMQTRRRAYKKRVHAKYKIHEHLNYITTEYSLGNVHDYKWIHFLMTLILDSLRIMGIIIE